MAAAVAGTAATAAADVAGTAATAAADVLRLRPWCCRCTVGREVCKDVANGVLEQLLIKSNVCL